MNFKLWDFLSKLYFHLFNVEIRKIHVCFSLDIKHVTLTGINEKAYGVKYHLLQVKVSQYGPLCILLQ